MKITLNEQLSNVPNYEDFLRFIVPILTQIKDALNGGITSTDNLTAKVVTFNFAAANTTYAVTHKIGIIPTGYIKISGPDVRIFDGVGAATKDQIFLQSSGIGTSKILVFV